MRIDPATREVHGPIVTPSASSRRTALMLAAAALAVRLLLLGVTYPGQDGVASWEDVAIATSLIDRGAYAMDYSGFNAVADIFGLPAGVEPLPVGSRATAIKPPVYPLLVAATFVIGGQRNFLLLFFIHALLAAATAALIYLTLRGRSHLVALISALAFVAYLPFAYHSIHVPESSTLTLFLIALFAYSAQRFLDNPRYATLAGMSLVGTVLGMTETVTLPLIVAALIYLCFVAWRTIPQWLIGAGLALATVALVLSPWLVRNALAFGNFPMLRTGVGTNLLLTLRAADAVPDETLRSIAAQLTQTDEAEEDAIIRHAMVQWVRDNPSAYLGTIWKNFLNYWWETDDYVGVRDLKYLLGRKLPYVLLLVLALPAMACHMAHLMRPPASQWTDGLLVISLFWIVACTGLYSLLGAHNIRYHFAVELLMLPFAAATVALGLGWMRRHRGAADAGDPSAP